MFDLWGAVVVAGLSVFSAIIAPYYVLIPLGLALLYQDDPESAAFVGFIVVLLVGTVVKLIKAGRKE